VRGTSIVYRESLQLSAPEPGWVGWSQLWLAVLPRFRSAAHAHLCLLLACALLLAFQRLSQWTVASGLAQAESTASPSVVSPAAAFV